MSTIHMSSLTLPTISQRQSFSSFPNSKPIDSTRIKASPIEAEAEQELKRKIEMRVCTNRTCRKQGSLDTLQVLSGIAPPYVTVNSCGCLGHCGAGPNVVVLPDAVFVKHCGTASRAAEIMTFVCLGKRDDVEGESRKSLEALALRKRAEDEMSNGNFSEAHSLLSQAIDLKPFGGVHIILKDRSAAELAMGNLADALDDAKEALTIAPNYPEGYICQGDALMAADQVDAADKSYSMALELDPSIRRSKSFKARIAKLKEKLALANLE
ncbi:uncharacterized protein LOC107779875 isoform X2 [Nicotiana tabacum]|uniref:Uncharacterized protein LOC107779875 isoform X2 n=2 Tax=Nicotiana TaxID=4085 RepID=A0A1S3YUF7_TOBAC|nr:PREDICTED: uncharacterized protein LOC104229103 [Nicotiana sylvestris]XP_016455859.1 PREDICTED: uncharacterized protein LOC107779875 isoform X2 [Nicotiana tabacum]